MKELTNTRWIVVKGVLFVLLGLLSSAALLLADAKWQQGAFLVVAVWAFCRFYHFLFYVVERYVDPNFRFRGLWPVVLYMLRRRRSLERREL